MSRKMHNLHIHSVDDIDQLQQILLASHFTNREVLFALANSTTKMVAVDLCYIHGGSVETTTIDFKEPKRISSESEQYEALESAILMHLIAQKVVKQPKQQGKTAQEIFEKHQATEKISEINPSMLGLFRKRPNSAPPFDAASRTMPFPIPGKGYDI